MSQHAFGCMGNTIKLRSGLYLDLADPQPDQFRFGDIAAGLSKICRFGGQIPRFYSVAEHSWLCAHQAAADGGSESLQIAALMHDAAEAFLGDVVKPLKIMLAEYQAIERRVEAVIAAKFAIDFEVQEAAVREIDQAMLIAERRLLFRPDGQLWAGEAGTRKLTIACHCWEPERAEMMFVRRARELGLPEIRC